MRERRRVIGCVVVAMFVWVACDQPEPEPRGQALQAQGKPEIAWRESRERVERAPIALTASDGTGLLLVSLQARTVIEDPLAFTELHLVFNNPEPRRREGRFEITLPPRAAVSRFAMRVGDEMQEGEVVERRRAQQVYEDFLHRKQDPALLENAAGNEFSARVFPIEANADKEIIISYSEELSQRGDPYRLLLQGLPTLRGLEVDVQVGSNSATGTESSARARGTIARLRIQELNHVPAGNIEVRLPAQKAVALRSGDLVVARVVPKLDTKSEPLDNLTVLLDTSASRALGFAAQLERLAALLSALRERAGKDFELRVLAYDQGVYESYRGPASGFGLREQTALLERDALGASSLSQALAALARTPDGHTRVLVIGDGVITAGEDDSTALREAVAKLAAHGVQRLDALAEGGIQDLETLSAITRAGLRATGCVLDSRAELSTLVDKLLGATRDRVQVQIRDASWVYPTTLEGVQSGDEYLVFAELAAGTPLQIELVGAGAETFETMEAPKPLIERAVARAKIAALSAELRAARPDASEQRAQLEARIVELSMEERVVSDYTALLVLETAQDYERFGIAQNALTNILQVGDEGIELVDRKGRADDTRRPVMLTDEEERALQIMREARAEGSIAERAVRTQAAPEKKSSANAAPVEPPTAAAKPGSAPPPSPLPRPSSPARIASRDESPSDLDTAGLRSRSGSGSGLGDLGKAKGELKRQEPQPENEIARAGSGSGTLGTRGAFGEQGSLGGATSGASDEPDAMLAVEPKLEPKVAVVVHGAQGITIAEASSAARSPLRARALSCLRSSDPFAMGGGRVSLELSISDKGLVSDAFVSGGSLGDNTVRNCILAGARSLRFPKPEGANSSVQLAITLSFEDVVQRPVGAYATPRPRPRPRPAPVKLATPAIDDAYSGAFADVLGALRQGDTASALTLAKAAHAEDPGDVIGLVALGEAFEATRSFEQAARAYGSIIDLFPSRADLRRMASARLERLPGSAEALALAVDSYRHAVEQRPDQPSGARALAFALVKQGDLAAAFEVLEQAAARSYPEDRFEGVARILREDLGLVGAALIRSNPTLEARVHDSLAAHGGALDRKPSLRFVLHWETDANDVDFHIYDGSGGHAFYQKPKLASGGSLYADITTGYGPECFAIPGSKRAYPYVLQAHYFARGPMGYGMGKVQVIEHDGHGVLQIGEHPFVIMKDKAFIELARLPGPGR